MFIFKLAPTTRRAGARTSAWSRRRSPRSASRYPTSRRPALTGPGFGNAQAGEPLGAFGIERSPSRRGCPYDNAVGESTSKVLKAELVYRESLSDTRGLQAKLSDYARLHDRSRLRSTLGYMSPVEFREAGLSL